MLLLVVWRLLLRELQVLVLSLRTELVWLIWPWRMAMLLVIWLTE